jgi:hypothetical protein
VSREEDSTRLSLKEIIMAAKHLLKRHAVRGRTLALLALICSLGFAGCRTRPPDAIDPRMYPSGTAYIYQPLNPTTVWIRDRTPEEEAAGDLDGDETSYDFNRALLRDLDTETVRVALNTLSGDVDLTGGVVGTSIKGESYVLIVDYIKYITYSREVDVVYPSMGVDGKEVMKSFQGMVPMYTGIGLRIRAEFKAHEGGLNVSGLPALAVAASTNGISGRLTVQTLGITGPEVTGLLPIISDISVTSIQNAVQAVGAIKAKIYEDTTTVYPKIVGFESPERDPALIRAITGAMYATEISICPTVHARSEGEGRIFWIDWSWPEAEEDPSFEDES